MSDDYDYEYDDDYADFFDSDDEPPEGLAEHVDSLAEHTSHSPVLVNAHPDYEVEWDEWEYLTDGYYDAEQENANTATTQPGNTADKSQMNTTKRKRGLDDHDAEMEAYKKRRKKIAGGREGIRQPHQSQQLQQPLVVWKEWCERDGGGVPMLQPGDGKQVALLENWREFVLEDEDVEKQNRSESAGEGGSQDVKRNGSSKTSEPSRQSAKRRAEPSRLVRQKKTNIQQTEHLPDALEDDLGD